MVYLIISACVIAYGIYYAANPMRSLKRKYYMEDEIPELSIKTARVMGVIIALFGGVSFVVNLIHVLKA